MDSRDQELGLANSHFRYLEEDEANNADEKTGESVYDDMSLGELLESTRRGDRKGEEEHSNRRVLLQICDGRAPLKSSGDEINLKCMYGGRRRDVVVAAASTTVSELTRLVVEKLVPVPEQQPSPPVEIQSTNNEMTYYLKTLDWLGDVESILNDLGQTCAQADLKHNQALYLDRGVLLPPDYFKISLWLHLDDHHSQSDSSQADMVTLNELIDHKQRSFRFT